MHSIAILGAGMMGNVHARAYRAMGEISSLWIVDPVESRAKAISEKYGANVASFEEVLENGVIDIVDICTPTFTHGELAVRALEAGKHVFCEKPVALKIEEARAMDGAAKKSGRKFMVGHVVRFFPQYIRVRELAFAGDIGEIVMARLYRGGSFPSHGIDNWFADIDKSGGVFVDLSIHDFDFLRKLLGPVKTVEARSVALSSERKKDSFDHGMAILRFESGALAHVEGSWAEPAGMPVNFGTFYEFVGTKGMITNSYERETTLRLQTSIDGKPKYSQENTAYYDPYAEELKSFILSIDEDREVPVNGQEAVESLRVALAANLSAKLHRPVELSEVF
ncbi:MAG TPA: Gfo/Idh/MocA family oxidoreductase [Mesotoga infera]|jgi:predicted dehydrogenase|nr:Gfo/Idh/MocA family oxidoreductase [Mesotoga sp.]NLI06106.1 Gfo/Idh/MocA family oxidoreductase [Thermotogaceae bacterium]HON28015.1 Gfo/Idh/MocA family oxidoreductase [Mesotoga infera]HOI64313.1 Gfo/Idh/MocA family oxidoreductase [Mesotoga sp.]HPD37973.1 Gfo/Idh/MocA family oxidoreductase [Mesotoga infera]